MENKNDRPKGAKHGEWFFLKARVALAAAIIKSKPPGMSSREYAEALACKLRSCDEGWKKKGEELQQEVLRLRQELLMSRAAASAAGQDDQVYTSSQDLFGHESVEEGSETPDLLPAAVSQQPPVSPVPDGRPVEVTPLPHVQFLRSLCVLHRVGADQRGLEALWFSRDGDAGSVLVDSVCQLLDSVVTACRNPPPLGPRDLVLQACQVVAQAMELYCCQRLPSVEVMRRVEKPLKELTGILLHCHQLSAPVAAEKLMEYLITLGSSNMSKSLLIRHILSQISDVADQLWQTFKGLRGSGLDRFPVDQYQNSWHLFRILETLLQTSKVACRVDGGSEQTGFLGHLKERVFVMSDEFPLFCMYMWRIGGLLSSSDRRNVSNSSNLGHQLRLIG